MSRWEKALFWAALALAGGTGLGYGLARWFGERLGEFGPEPHPWQGALQHLHVLAVPLLVFALGWMVKGHALPGFRRSARRASGSGLLALGAPMVLSGYAIQVATGPAVQLAFRWFHGISTALFLAACAIHALAAAFGKADGNDPSRDRRDGIEEPR